VARAVLARIATLVLLAVQALLMRVLQVVKVHLGTFLAAAAVLVLLETTVRVQALLGREEMAWQPALLVRQ
jgi:hypothetical protein